MMLCFAKSAGWVGEVARGDDMIRLPASVVENYEWQKDGACVGLNESLEEDVFFHPWNDTPKNRMNRERKAKAICAVCPVKAVCLEWSLKVQEPYGVWGGVGEDERKALLRRRRIIR
jgi:WhiB family redox-sensing transcriptional regulator